MWAYRERPRALDEPVHRVKIVARRRNGGAVRVVRLDGDNEGLPEWVSSGSLLCPWTVIDRRLDDERHVLAVREASSQAGGTVESEAAAFVLQHSGLGRRVIIGRSKADTGVLRIGNVAVAAEQLQLDLATLANDYPLAYTDRYGVLIGPWPMSLCVVKRAAEVFASAVLEAVHREEAGWRTGALYRSGYTSSLGARGRERQPDDKRGEQVRALVREWCGEAPVQRFDELLALRTEVARLGTLIERAIHGLRKHGASATAATIERDLGVPISTLIQQGRR